MKVTKLILPPINSSCFQWATIEIDCLQFDITIEYEYSGNITGYYIDDDDITPILSKEVKELITTAIKNELNK